MALANLDEFTATLSSAAPEIVPMTFGATSTTAGRMTDLWLVGTPAAVFPTAAVVPTRATAGALGQQNGGAGRLSLMGARLNTAAMTGLYLICDRLSHQGGLSGTTTGAQTTNLPTAALTRYTDGVGVMAGLTIATAVGTTATTVTASYTNTAPTAGRVSTAVVFGSAAYNKANRMILLPLEAGDVGVRAVASVTLAGTTGTAGNFGVTLFKPLLAVFVESNSGVVVGDYITGSTGGSIPEVVDDACLFAMAIGTGVNAGVAGSLFLSEV